MKRRARQTEEHAERATRAAPHNDGIGEEDHRDPALVQRRLLGTIVFAIVYVVYYIGVGWTSRGQYEAEVAAADALRGGARRRGADRESVPRRRRGDRRGQAGLRARSAPPVTSPTASGLVGPSLVDPYWKYGHADAELFQTVMEGRPLGMPPWGPQLGSEKVWKVLAYVETLPKRDEPGVGLAGVRRRRAAAGSSAAVDPARAVAGLLPPSALVRRTAR